MDRTTATCKLLVLGGTTFLGRHLVDEALERGYQVTLFNRGRSDPSAFDRQVEKVTGDRNTDLEKLAGRQFDICVDTSGYLPRQLEESGRILAKSVDFYAFVSSISVYASFHEDLDESGAVSELPADADPTRYTDDYYGHFKALCERAIESAMPGRVLQVRSGLIVGSHDPTNRFTYWPARVARGADMLAPVSPDWPVQIIHARDQAHWILDMAEKRQAGTYNVTSPKGFYSLGDVIEAAARVTGAEVNTEWVPASFLEEQNVRPWMELPLWLPESMADMSRVSADKAVEAGLTFMSLDAIIEETLAWYDQLPAQQWPAGLDPMREKELLDSWRRMND